jgi:bifunctional N-acetylglucosamine-1-phosphate-uridyltransferase/glucosamine-1-phosphate-acetyltransferase GlmU-like protein
MSAIPGGEDLLRMIEPDALIVGGGSTISKSTEPGALSVARGKQVSIANWARPEKKPKAQ